MFTDKTSHISSPYNGHTTQSNKTTCIGRLANFREINKTMVIYDDRRESGDHRVHKCKEYVAALDEERKKIQVFERELPLCLELVSQAIERCRQQMSLAITESFDGQSDQCSDQTSSDHCPVFEEFMPMKSTSSTNEDVDDQQQQKQQLPLTSKFTSSKDWLASAQLSIQAPDPPFEDKLAVEKRKTADTDSGGRGGGSNDEDKGRSNKKERRCWSPELHRRFLHALQQLGGAHVATPKQIRELMKVNGLTNDEIKSHLQKYRLHTRRLNPTLNGDTLSPHLLVVGRLWMPPLDYTANGTSSPLTSDIKNAKAVYAPVASLPSSITASPYKTRQP